MVNSIADIKKKFSDKAKDDKVLSDFYQLYLSSNPIGDDSLGQRFIITDKSLNDAAHLVNETIFLDLGETAEGMTYRFTIPLLKRLGLDLALEMQEYLVNKK